MANDPCAHAQATGDNALKTAQAAAADVEHARQALQRAREYVDAQHQEQAKQLSTLKSLIEQLSKGLQDHHTIIKRLDTQIQALQKKK